MDIIAGLSVLVLALALLFAGVSLRPVIDRRYQNALASEKRMRNLVGRIYTEVAKSAGMDSVSAYVKSEVESTLSDAEIQAMEQKGIR
jgi:hypothetical protein